MYSHIKVYLFINNNVIILVHKFIRAGRHPGGNPGNPQMKRLRSTLPMQTNVKDEPRI